MRRLSSGPLPTLLLYRSSCTRPGTRVLPGAVALVLVVASLPSLAGAADPPASARQGRPASAPASAAVNGDDDDDPSTAAPPAAPHELDADDADRAAATLPKAAPGPVYHGVTPGTAALPPRAPRLPVKGPARLTWPGFQVRDGVATVFLQLTSDVPFDAVEAADRVVYTLRGATVPLRNNLRPLDVSAFGTVVRSVETRRRGKDVEVTIHLKQKAARKDKVTDAAGGYRMIVIELVPS